MTRRFQFSLRAMLVATALLSVAFGFWCQRIRPQLAAIAIIEGKGGAMLYPDRVGSDSPAWLRMFDGYRVDGAYLNGFGDDDLPMLTAFPRLEEIGFSKDTTVTRTGLAYLKRQFPNCGIFLAAEYERERAAVYTAQKALHAAGWSTSDSAVRVATGEVWEVRAHPEVENIVTKAPSQLDAWREAVRLAGAQEEPATHKQHKNRATERCQGDGTRRVLATLRHSRHTSRGKCQASRA